MSVTGKRFGWQRLLAAAAVAMAAAAATGAVATHSSVPGTHAVADNGVIHGDGIQGTG